MNFTVDINFSFPNLVTIVSPILKALTTMTTQFDTLSADIAAATTSSNAAAASNLVLIGLANDLKALVTAAVAKGTGMTDAEVQILRDKLSEMTVADDAAKVATDAAVAADAPAPVAAPIVAPVAAP